jgi:hypothetical protein
MKHICFLTGLYGRRDPLIVERQGRSLVADGYRVSYIVESEKNSKGLYGSFYNAGWGANGRYAIRPVKVK